MRHATPKLRDFAKHLIAHETARKSAATEIEGALLVCDRLRPHLATFMGSIGFTALLSRALALAAKEFPSLRILHVNTDGSFRELEPSDAPGGVALVAELLGLLVTFIGQDLTLRLVRDVWPKASLDESGFGKGSTNAEPE